MGGVARPVSYVRGYREKYGHEKLDVNCLDFIATMGIEFFL